MRADLDPLVELRGGSGEACLFGEGAGGFVVAGPAAGAGRARRRRAQSGAWTFWRSERPAERRLEISAAEAEVSLPLGRRRARLALARAH